MKEKPNLDEFRRPSSPDEFIEAAVPESPSAPKPKRKTKEKKQTMLVHLPRKLLANLKLHAVQESTKGDKRISYSDIVERALIDYFAKKDAKTEDKKIV